MCLTGILVVKKPVCVRSTFCVKTVRNILGKKIKVGHGGTLDSTASGVLILLIGQATRLSNFVMDMSKCYEVTVQLGSETSTDDESGDVLSEKKWNHVTDDLIDSALCGFLGWRMQTPPNISAVHVNGERAHKLTRAGADITILPKPVYFYKILRTSNLNSEGKVSFKIYCNRGTYIRSFARDLGRIVGTVAHVYSLERTCIGMFKIENSVDFNEITEMKSVFELEQKVLPIQSIKGSYASYTTDKAVFGSLSNGLSVAISQVKRIQFPLQTNTSKYATIFYSRSLSICSIVRDKGSFTLKPTVNIINAEDIKQ